MKKTGSENLSWSLCSFVCKAALLQRFVLASFFQKLMKIRNIVKREINGENVTNTLMQEKCCEDEEGLADWFCYISFKNGKTCTTLQNRYIFFQFISAFKCSDCTLKFYSFRIGRIELQNIYDDLVKIALGLHGNLHAFHRDITGFAKMPYHKIESLFLIKNRQYLTQLG